MYTFTWYVHFHIYTFVNYLSVCLSVCLHGHLNPLYTAYMVAKEEQLISSSLKPKGQWHWGLVCSFRDMGPTTFAQKKTTFCGFSMGRNQYWAGRVYDLCFYYMTGTPEGSAESGFMEKPGIEPATPVLTLPYFTAWSTHI